MSISPVQSAGRDVFLIQPCENPSLTTKMTVAMATNRQLLQNTFLSARQVSCSIKKLKKSEIK